MEKYFGYAGRILRVNLSEESFEITPLSQDLIQNFIGGRSINAKILYDEVPARIDPFDPKNCVILGAGPLVGTIAPSVGRYNATTKSAITRIFGDSNAGGHWGPELKYAGFDHIVIFGEAKQPKYLWISDGKAELRDASHLWGKDTWETTEAIQKELGDPEVQVLCIGPAGSNLVQHSQGQLDLIKRAGPMVAISAINPLFQTYQKSRDSIFKYSVGPNANFNPGNLP